MCTHAALKSQSLVDRSTAEVSEQAVHSQIGQGEAVVLVIMWTYKKIQFVISVSGRSLTGCEALLGVWSCRASTASDCEREKGELLHLVLIYLPGGEVKF